YHKCKDDIADERGFKRLGACVALPYFAYLRYRAKKRLPEIDTIAARGMQTFAKAEKEAGGSADIPANAFGALMGELLSHATDGEAHAVLHELGKSLGRWVYLLDAAEDYEQDAQKGRFNALHALYGSQSLTDEQRTSLDTTLTLELADAVAAADLIDFDGRDDLRAVIYNILCLGMPAQADQVLYPKKECKKCKGERGA
ncbi:MAG: hypothetical protein J6R46_00990, partial [Clostridia bacterium]|nr:hypothetical protein [Clostridia bacterium]